MTSRRVPRPLAAGGAVLVGILTALQARVNGSLGQALGDGFVTGFISFGSGFVIVLAIALATPGGRAALKGLGAGRRRGEVRGWMLLGGLAGAFTVATQGFTVGLIGVSLFTVGVVAGQTAGGLFFDRLGYGPAGVVQLSVGRVAGGALAICAVFVSFTGVAFDRVPVWMLVLPFLAGIGISWQQATNGRLRHAAKSALVATVVNFAGGAAALAIASLVRIVVGGAPSFAGAGAAWLYVGGAIGVVYIFLSAALVQHTGVLLLGLGSVVGLLVTSVTLDAIWPADAEPSALAAIAAVVLALTGAVVAALWSARGSARGSGGRGGKARPQKNGSAA